MEPFKNPIIRFISEPKYRWLRHTLFILLGFVLGFKLHGGVRFDGSFSNIENKDHHSYTSGRAKTYDLNTGIEFGLKYFLN